MRFRIRGVVRRSLGSCRSLKSLKRIRDTATSGEGCHARLGRSRVKVSRQMDAATATVGVVSVFGDQWVTAPQCAGGGGSLEDARGWRWACSAVGGRWCRGGAESSVVLLRMERVSARQQAWFGVERRASEGGARRSAAGAGAGAGREGARWGGYIREAGRGLTTSQQ